MKRRAYATRFEQSMREVSRFPRDTRFFMVGRYVQDRNREEVWLGTVVAVAGARPVDVTQVVRAGLMLPPGKSIQTKFPRRLFEDFMEGVRSHVEREWRPEVVVTVGAGSDGIVGVSDELRGRDDVLYNEPAGVPSTTP